MKEFAAIGIGLVTLALAGELGAQQDATAGSAGLAMLVMSVAR